MRLEGDVYTFAKRSTQVQTNAGKKGANVPGESWRALGGTVPTHYPSLTPGRGRVRTLREFIDESGERNVALC